MIELQRLDPLVLSRAFAEKAELEPRARIEQLLESLDGPLIFDVLVDELGPECYVEGRPTL